MRQMIVLSAAMGTVAAITLGLSACGGGGGGGGYTMTSSSSTASTSSTSSSSTSVAAAGPNVVTGTVSAGPSGVNAVNTLYVTVNVCQPGSTTNCVSVPNVEVDTGSYGLRIMYEALTPAQWTTLGLKPVTVGGKPLAECAQWADGYSWGPVMTADMEIPSTPPQSASNISMQILQGTSFSNVPSDCANSGVNGEEDTVASFGANGILGVGPFVLDCGPGCAPPNTAAAAAYYACAQGSTCSPSNAIAVPADQQVSNPVAFFAKDNNGVIVELPSVGATGAVNVTGAVVFGIGTESNNMVAGAGTGYTVFPATAQYGTITTVYPIPASAPNCYATPTPASCLIGSYMDTGSNGFFFQDSSITNCPTTGSVAGFYCPTTPVSLKATIYGSTGTPPASQNVTFTVANASTLTTQQPTFTAFNNLAGSLPSSAYNSPAGGVFDWGLSFFFGQNVAVAISCKSSFDSGVPSCAPSAPFFATAAN